MNRARNILRMQEVINKGITGKGIRAAVLDTGAVAHPDFADRIVCFKDFINARKMIYDDYGHGTHVTGILAGNGTVSGMYRGIAPQAEIVALKVLDKNGNGSRRDVLNGIYWTIENSVRYNIRIMNISVGTVKEGDIRDEALVQAVEKAWDAGIVVVVAAGNMGPAPKSITAPGNSKKVITVGSSDEFGNFSSGCGPTGNCVCKPDIVTPGARIMSCSNVPVNGKWGYCRKSGTSMATPIVSGAVALLLSREPWMTNVEVKMRLREAATDLGFPHNRQGWGLLNLERFVLGRQK